MVDYGVKGVSAFFGVFCSVVNRILCEFLPVYVFFGGSVFVVFLCRSISFVYMCM